MKVSFYIRTTLEWAEENENLVFSYSKKYGQIPLEHLKVILYSNARDISKSDIACFLYIKGKLKIRKSFFRDKFVCKYF